MERISEKSRYDKTVRALIENRVKIILTQVSTAEIIGCFTIDIAYYCIIEIN